MSIDASPKLMTADEFMALPDDGKERWLVDGQVYTIEGSMTVRNWVHGDVLIAIGTLLRNWLARQPLPRGKILGGEAGFRLRHDPAVLVGVDVAYASAELVAATPRSQAYFNGAPVLAVEILSPSDKHEDVIRKVQLYRDAGTVVWNVDPDLFTVQVLFPDRSSKSYDVVDDLEADPYLPGFRVAVAALFED